MATVEVIQLVRLTVEQIFQWFQVFFGVADFLGHLCQTQVPVPPGSQTPGLVRHIAQLIRRRLWISTVSATQTTTTIQSGKAPFLQARRLHPTLGS